MTQKATNRSDLAGVSSHCHVYSAPRFQIGLIISMDGLELQDYVPNLRPEKRSKHLELLTSERRLMAANLAQYILKRKTTLQIVVIRSRNLSIELLRMYAFAPILCLRSWLATNGMLKAEKRYKDGLPEGLKADLRVDRMYR